jgi:transposase
MRKIKEILRLKFDLELSISKIALSTGLSIATVERYIFRAKASKISWPLPEDMTDEALEQVLYPQKKRPADGYPEPDFEHIHKELKRKGVTLFRLWEEYITGQKEGYSYSQFCNVYKQWKNCDQTWMLQIHKAGEITFIDYSGLTIPIYDATNGLVAFNAQIFVSALGASSYIFCEATKNQQIADWIKSHCRMCQYYQGVTECWIPDNLKSAVTRADRYEPDINLSYLNAAQHYQVSIIPLDQENLKINPKQKDLFFW